MDWSLAHIVQATKGVANKTSSVVGHRIVTDSREPLEGAWFLALVGPHFDGHDFVLEAMKKGAVGCIVSRSVDHDGLEIVVSDTMKAYQDLASFYLSQTNAITIAITGSTGKTSTKEMVRDLLGTQLEVYASEANYNNDIGVPKTILAMPATTEALILEFGMRGPGEIRRLTLCAQPDIALVTNVGTAHIGRLGSREAIAKAKGEIYEGLSSSGLAILPQEEPGYSWLKTSADSSKSRLKTFSAVTDGKADQCPIELELQGFLGSQLTTLYRNAPLELVCKLPGRGMVSNLMAALLVADYCGIEPENITREVRQMNLPEHRLQIRNWNGVQVVDDSYNASAASMKQSLELLSQSKGFRLAVLGDMLELGSESLQLHEEVADYAVSLGKQIDFICVGVESKAMHEIFLRHGYSSSWYTNREAAQDDFHSRVSSYDWVLLKASRGVCLEKLLEEGSLA